MDSSQSQTQCVHSADLEYVDLDESCTVKSFLESFLDPSRAERDVGTLRVIGVFTVTPQEKDCASYLRSLQVTHTEFLDQLR